MKSSELRIGNWFKYGVDTINTVFQIVFDRREGHLINGVIPESHCSPILLTPEILEKAGFVEVEGNSYYRFFDYNNLRVFIHRKDSSVFATWCMNEIQSSFNFSLHQLQNLYFAITGEELNIEL